MQTAFLRLLAAFGLVLGLLPARVLAHGGVPASQQILWRDQTMLVPTPYWGVFLGTDGGDWQWICEEAINPYQFRRMALGKDGTLYATDRIGLTVSRDGGCTWLPVSRDIDRLEVTAIVADPVSARVWAAVTDADAGTGTGLWRSDDSGVTWQLAFALKGHFPLGLVLAEDGQAIAITSVSPAPRELTLHVSQDGGASFQSRSLSFAINGMTIMSMVPLWIDPRAKDQIYVTTQNANPNVLLRATISGMLTEAMRTDTGIRDMTRNARTDQVMVATSKGLWSAQGTAPLQPLSTLSASQCLSIHGDAVYACAWNYAPDQAAIAKLADSAASFSKVFQYHDTQSPVMCPAGTPVATICPPVWTRYADQLGIDLAQRERDKVAMASGCQASAGTASRASGWSVAFGLLFALSLHRRRRRRRLGLSLLVLAK